MLRVRAELARPGVATVSRAEEWIPPHMPCVCGFCLRTVAFADFIAHSWRCRAARYQPLPGGPIELKLELKRIK